MRYTTYFLVSFYSLFSFYSSSAQNCTSADYWIQASSKNLNTDSCKQIRVILESTLTDCLQEKDSFDASLGALYHQIGNIYYLCDLDYRKSLEYFEMAVVARNTALNPNHDDLGRSWTMIGSIYSYYFKNYPLSITAVEQAIIHHKKIESNLLVHNYNSLGVIHKNLGDYHQALFFLDKASQLIGEKNVREQYRTKKSEAQIHNTLKQYDKAIAKYQACKTLLERDGINKHLSDYAAIFNDLGESQFKIKNYTAAYTSLNQALSLYLSEKRPDSTNIIITYANLIQLTNEQGKYSQINTYFQKSLEIALSLYKSPYRPIIAELYYHKADADAAEKDYPTALKNFQNALKSLIPSFEPQTLSENPILSLQPTGDKVRLRSALYLKAQTYQQKYSDEKKQPDLAAAFDTYLTLDTLITQTRQSFKSVESKYFLQATIVPIYTQAIKTALALYKLTDKSFYQEAAHIFLARNKAVILLEGLQDEDIKFITIPDSLLAQESQLKKTNYELETTIYELEQNEGAQATIKHLRDSLFATKRAEEELIAYFEEEYPLYYQNKHNYYPSLSIATIQKQLEPDQAVIEFFVGKNDLFISAISKKHFQIYQTPLAETFESLAYDFIKMTRGDSLEEKRFTATAFQLYQDLLQEPLAALAPTINRLTIIPDDLLLLLPFDVLLTQPHLITPDTWHEDNIPYLIRKYALSQVYASSLLFNQQDQERLKEATKPFLGLGLERFDYTKTTDTLNSELDSLFQRNINGELPFSPDEVRNIQSIVGGDTLINRAATKQFLQKNGHEYQILHFATHGFADEDSPNNSALIFAKLPSQSDYLLRANEIASMNLNAKLAVLSACQTNYGPLQKGEGMRTLAKAFAYAGCPNLVATLANIIDGSSKDIFTSFYQHLKKGQTRDVALQQAKLNYLKNLDGPNKAHPNYWAQTILIGDTAVLKIGHPINEIWYLIGGTMLIMFLLWRFLKDREHSTLQ